MKRFIYRYTSALLAVMLLLSPVCVSEGAPEAVAAELFAEDAAPEGSVAAPQDEQVPEELEGLELPTEDAPEDGQSAPDAPKDDPIPEDDPAPQDEPDTPQDDPAPEDEPDAPQDDPDAPKDDPAPQDDPVPEMEEAPVAEEALPVESVDALAEAETTTDLEAAPAPEAALSLEAAEASAPPVLAEAGGIPQKLVLGRKETYRLSGGEAYASSRPKVVSVNAAGLVRARKRGKAVITVTAGGAVVGVCAVTVRAAPKRITLPKKRTVTQGQTLLLTPKVKGGVSHTIVWTSSNPAVATVDPNGVVNCVGVGKARITARTYNRKRASCTVKVNSPTTPARVSFPMATLFVGKGESVALRPELNPGAVAVFTYASKNKKVASVTKKGGVIKGNKLNKSTVITVRTHNGKKASLTVKVLKAPSKVTMNIPSATMLVEDVVELSAFLPVGTASQITWSSSKPEVAAVGEAKPFTAGNGSTIAVTALNPGTTVITASTYKGRKATCEIKVTNPASEESERTLKLLFIGNSHTYYNAMPLMVQSNANKAGYNCDVTRFTESAWALGDHMEDPDVGTAILEGGYDYVILQEKVNPMDADAFLEAARYFNDLIRQTKAVPVIYECWSKKSEPEKQGELNEANRRVANDIGALLAPVGELWWDYQRTHADVDLYDADGVHASKAGSEFAAGIIWNTINNHLKG